MSIVGVYVFLNLVFATIYFYTHGIENARHGSFADAFFFSVQTMATIGYGKLVPITPLANVLVTIEALFGLLILAMATGVIFAKFSRPTARVLFSKPSIIEAYEGQPAFMFRMANERANQIVEAQAHVVLVRNETSLEGRPLRRMHEVKLVRSSSVVFTLTWTAIHIIDESSPFHGETAESLRAGEVEIVVSLVGYDETFSQTIHARHSYLAHEVFFGARFVDILSRLPDGRRQVDYSRFHDVAS
jgi:inward rectifier potassium channel